MKRTATFLLSLLLLVTMIFPFNTIVGYASSNNEEYMIKSSVTFVANSTTWNFTEEEKAISLYMNTTWQTVNLINSSCSFENVKIDEDGNAIAILNMTRIAAGASTEYTVFYQVLSAPRNLPNIDESNTLSLSDIPHNLTDPYLSNSGTWMTNNTTLQSLAENLTGKETKVLVIVENFVNWIWTHIKYPQISHEVPLYPNETLSPPNEGDCDDQAILLISLCHIIGIPAYLQIGCIYDSKISTLPTLAWNGHIENTQIRIGWHGWAMVYIPPWGWLPVDLTYSSRGNPLNALNAIKTAAATDQTTIQYMNIIKTDYVTEARQYRSFLINNNFHIQTYDEIIPGHGMDPFGFISEPSMQYVLMALLVAAIATSSMIVWLYVWRVRKKTEKESISSSSPLSYAHKSS
jgi:hypothetical protein